MKYSITILMIITSSLIFSQNIKQYIDKQVGYSFMYPNKIDISYTPNSKHLSVFIYQRKVPLKTDEEMDFGFDNENIKEVKNGLERGEIKGIPFYYPEYSSIVKRKDKYLIKNIYTIFGDIGDFYLRIGLIFFHNDYLVKIDVNGEYLKELIEEKYMNQLFIRDQNYRTAIEWKNEDSILEFNEIVNNRRDRDLDQWLSVFDIILNTLEFK